MTGIDNFFNMPAGHSDAHVILNENMCNGVKLLTDSFDDPVSASTKRTMIFIYGH